MEAGRWRFLAVKSAKTSSFWWKAGVLHLYSPVTNLNFSLLLLGDLPCRILFLLGDRRKAEEVVFSFVCHLKPPRISHIPYYISSALNSRLHPMYRYPHNGYWQKRGHEWLIPQLHYEAECVLNAAFIPPPALKCILSVKCSTVVNQGRHGRLPDL